MLTNFVMMFWCFFNRNFTVFFALQAWLRNFKNVIWTHYLLCLQHVCYFAETSKNRIAITFFESFSYRFLITFCRGPDLLKMSQNTSQNGASGHPKSQKNKKTDHSKKHQKNNTQKVSFRMQNDLILKSPGPPKWDQKSMKIKLRAHTVAKRGLRAQIWGPGAAPEGVSGQNSIQKHRKIIIF